MKNKVYNVFIKLILFAMLIGMGVLLGKTIINILDNKLTLIRAFFNIICFIIFFLLFYCCNVLIHEMGHLLCGMATGYKFSSFTIGNIIVLNKQGKLLVKKFHIPGTGGQCLMKPPSYNDGSFAYKMYLLGGLLANLLGLLIACVMVMVQKEGSIIICSYIFSDICIILANIRITDFGEVDTDVGTFINVRNDTVSKRAFWLQLYIATMQNDDIEMQMIPKDMLALPSNIEFSNNLKFYWYYIVCMYEFKNKNYDKYRKMVNDIKSEEQLTQSVYMKELLCELLFLDIVEFQYVYNKEYWNALNLEMYIDRTQGFLSRQRLLYAYHLLLKNDAKKAEYHLKRFGEIAKTWPYFSDIKDEKDLVDLVEKKYAKEMY